MRVEICFKSLMNFKKNLVQEKYLGNFPIDFDWIYFWNFLKKKILKNIFKEFF